MTSQIVIIGFMGTGKSTVARSLALRVNGLMVDLDDLIAKNQGSSPAEIIEQHSESHFRKIETQALRAVLAEGTARIVAVGGGAWTIAENRQLTSDYEAFTVWLDAPFELCWRRIKNGRSVRPLARSRELAEKLYLERRSSYRLASATVPIGENDSVDEIAEKIVDAFSRRDTTSRSQPETKGP